MSRTETMVREYKNTGAYKSDAARLAKQGWTVINTTERRPNPGCGRGCLIGLFAFLIKPSPILVVTYSRSRP